ncbi:HDOD domain-containing protein [Vibrio gazogenes]|uniref:HD-like signal output (HDOD) domain, no enzymatic activity n=1 Tax=Vibrio gazogenes DSM 21264 = NBRC 103151 TaxID=1123492 RepID=A0A1M5AWS0_VIBGA|nr:HDOD domain-containing protein [Vibrio gazogenes]USP12742.1 HDOD domain-containing protein [Vibrio gazogenes]SHF34659.1 HD-like signal output (HDOD) domain, no enzymatic activity [Vibrio gazogenes DSM 21264] [Vibrio gazogenes DSM 21264 = NBRC 103151]SJN57475.1 HDOD domain protein [Vibrio gazogenes]
MANLEVVCVDDDEFMLKAIGRLVRRLRPEWRFLLLDEPMRWEEIMADSDIEHPAIFISDLLMPKKRGDVLLNEVKMNLPESIRVLLTGDTTQELPQKAHGYAHFVLPKPFTQDDFEHLFQCAERLHKMPFNAECRQKLGSLSGLPVLPHTVQELQNVIASPNCDMHLMAEVISHEPSLVARIFQIANSSYFGFRRHTDSLSEAVSRLGATLIETIAVSLLTQIPHHRVSPKQHQQVAERALRVGSIARLIAKEMSFARREQDKVFVASLLTSIGTLLVLEEGATLENIRTYLGLQDGYHDHHVAAAYLLILWGYDIDVGDMILSQSHIDFLSQNETVVYGSIVGLAYMIEKFKTDEQFKQIAEQLPNVVSDAVLALIPLLLETA